ncbi:hypothetical protein HMPREF1082_02175, partial [[Clostridium] clostridioforme 90A7]
MMITEYQYTWVSPPPWAHPLAP